LTLAEFEQEIFAAALASPICGIPSVRRLTASSIGLRVPLDQGDFIDAFYNEQTNTTAFALIRQGRRVFGADNSGGWHVHPIADPEKHIFLPTQMRFSDFLDEIVAGRS
jgi:hypothetical protein